ncbi:MAG: hypothetical protein ACK40G_01970 [Cytophagaceae bacterium]
MKNFIYTIVTLCVILFYYSCQEKKSNAVITDADSLKTSFSKLKDTVNQKWNNLILSDDQKFSDIKRLLDEISYSGKFDLRLHDSLTKVLPEVLAKRYTPENLTVKRIEDYDMETDRYIQKVLELAAKAPNLPNHPLAQELINDINEANVNTLIKLRINYDRWAQVYNIFIEENKSQLEKIGIPADSLKKKALFSDNSNS